MKLHQTKRVKKAIGWGLAGVGVRALTNVWEQDQRKEDSTHDSFNFKELFSVSLSAGVKCALAGFLVGAFQDYQNSLEEPIDTDSALRKYANRIRLNKSDPIYLNLKDKADIIISLLEEHFGAKLKYKPKKTGSTEKGCALKNKFDIDISLEFKAGSFRSIEAMFESVYCFLVNLKGNNSITDVIIQKRSIGVYVRSSYGEHKIDIVPCKLSNNKKGASSGYLYQNESSFLFDNSSYIKTDFRQLMGQKLGSLQSEVFVLLKWWKEKESLPLSSHLLHNLIVDAYQYNKGAIPKGTTGKIIMVWEHIAAHLDYRLIRSIENTNNVLTDISYEKKTQIVDACKKAIEDYKYQSNSIIETIR